MSYKGGSFAHVPAYSIGGKPKDTNKNANPGPGSYDMGGGFGYSVKDPKYSFGKSMKPGNKSQVPGPGTYDSDGGFGGKSYGIGSDARFKFKDNGVPGAGTYDSIHGSRVGYSFGRQSRETKVKKGGADYDIPHSIPDVATYNYPSKESRKIKL